MADLSEKTAAAADGQSGNIGDSAPFPPGQMLAGKYKIVSILGKGGMATVYRVQQVFLNKEMALKVLDSRKISDDVRMRRFQLEAKAAHSLNHPNLVKVHDFGLLDNEQPYLAMDLVEGATLANYIKEHGPLGVDMVGPIFAQLCFGLSYAHEQSVVHRDIKPSNIMLVTGVPLGSEGSIKILDFGIAKIAGDEGGEIQALTRTGEVCGSPFYMSPEQCSGDALDHRGDIYSVGCVLFETLTGTPPFVGQNALRTMLLHQTELVPQLKEASLGKEFPHGLQQIVDKMLRKSPFERYQNLGMVAHDLAGVCNPGQATIKLKPLTGLAGGGKFISMRSWHFYGLLVAIVLSTATVTAIVTAQYCRAWLPTQAVSITAKSAGEGTQQLLNSEGEAIDEHKQKIKAYKEAFAKVGTITSTIVGTGAKKQRQFVFPKDYAIGSISSRRAFTQREVSDKTIECKGTVLIPDVPLTLDVDGRNHDSLEVPSVFKKIGAKEFSSLCLTTSDAPLESTLSDDVTQILTIACDWSNLQSVSLNSDAVLDKSVCAALNKLRHLRALELSTTKMDPAEVARQPLLGRLDHLRLCWFRHPIDDILRSLSGSANLQVLVLEDDIISPEALALLRRCPHLEYLQLRPREYTTLDDRLLKAVAQLKSLRHVYIKETRLTQTQLAILTQCHWLTEIKLDPTPTNIALQTVDPRIKISQK